MNNDERSAQALRIAKLQRYSDPQSEKLGNWNWRPLPQVAEELGNLREIPSHVQNFGRFMDDTAKRAKNQGLTARDLIKAYTITLSSIQRGALSTDKIRAKGMPVPNAGPMLRPEGAFGEWLHTPGGQAYLDAAEKGQVHEGALKDMAYRFGHYGLVNKLGEGMRWAAENLPGKESQVSHLVAAAMEKASPVREWRDFAKGLPGIDTSKAGFVASLMGRGDQPTFDARQRILHTGMTSKQAGNMIAGEKMNPKAQDALDRLISRQKAMNLDLPEELSPYYQHLAHHAVWDQAEGDQTTHQDVMDSMRHAASGGRIKGGHVANHPLAQVMRAMGLPGLIHKAVGGEVSDDEAADTLNALKSGAITSDQAIQQAMSRIGDVTSQDPMIAQHARDVEETLRTKMGHEMGTGSYYKVTQPIEARDVRPKVKGMPKNPLKKPVNKTWEDFYNSAKGGTLLNLGGDRSNFGILTHIGQEKLAWPVKLYAGPKYMLEPNRGEVWANNPNHATALRNVIETAAKKGDVYGAYAPMGQTGSDSAHHMFDALMAQIPNRNIDSKDAADFDQLIKSGAHITGNGKVDVALRNSAKEYLEKWPGILNSKAASKFALKLPGNQRAAIVKAMDKGYWRDRDFPAVGITRVAVTDPDVVGAGGNLIGHRIAKLDPDAILQNIKTRMKHPTYSSPTLGEYEADVPLLPRQDVLVDATKKLMGKPTTSGQIVHPYSMDALGRSTYRKLTEEQKQTQPINQEMIDSIQSAIERRKTFGIKTGGRVSKFGSDAVQKAVNIARQHKRGRP
jgi:hypothetical protein